MAVRILLVLAALVVLHGCDQASSPPEHRTPPPTPKSSNSATTTQREIHDHDAPALLGDEQMAKLDDAGRNQLLACQRDMVHEVWGDKQATEEEIAYLIKQARKKDTTVQQEMWSTGYRCPEKIPGMEHLEVE